jgi:hypothetical protein
VTTPDPERMKDPAYAAKYERARKSAIKWGMIFERAQSHVEEGLNLYGRLNEKQRESVALHVKGKHVHDLGAGNGMLSLELLKLGAAKVTAIDRHEVPVTDPRIEVRQGYFHDFQMLRPDVVFVSWPPNHKDYDLFRLCRDARVTIYVGKNTDGTACGQPELFEDMLHRKLLAYHADRQNTLIIVGKAVRRKRSPMGEERAGLEMNSGPMLEYTQVEGEEAQASQAKAQGPEPHVARDRSAPEARRQER